MNFNPEGLQSPARASCCEQDHSNLPCAGTTQFIDGTIPFKSASPALLSGRYAQKTGAGYAKL